MTSFSWKDRWAQAVRLGRQEFLVLPDRRYSYAQTCKTIREFCSFFDHRGMKAGDRVIFCSDHEYCVATGFLAALLHGLVPTNLGSTTKSARGRSVIESTDAALFIADREIANEWGVDIETAYVSIPQKPSRFRLSRQSDWPLEQTANGEVEPRCAGTEQDLAYLLFTSGSTSDPSGVMITHGNLQANITSVGRVTDLRHSDRMFNDAPFAHTDGLIHGPVLAFAEGATVVRAGGFQLSKLEDWLNTIGREGCTQIITTPFVWSAIFNHAEHDDYFSAPEMRVLITSAARIDLSLWEAIEKRFGKPLVNEYGMTETVMAAFHAGCLPEMGAIGTIGLPAHCEATLEDDGTGDTGELLLRGPAISPGYWKNSERTKKTRTADGWFRTGDIARKRPDGSFELVGRAKSIINSAGMRIHPYEIDEAIEAHPKVRSSTTIGIDHDEFGQIAATAVELDEDLSVTQIYEHARRSLEPHKVPKEILIFEEIPRTDSGKPKLAETAEKIKSRLAVGGMPLTEDDQNANVEALVYRVAGQVFQCDPTDLWLAASQDDLAGWDSFSQLRLILELEDSIGVQLPSRKLAAVKTLGDLVDIVGSFK